MNQQVKEQDKVSQYIRCITPNDTCDYDSMLSLLAKANPAVKEEVLTDTKKRILYLQLIAHFVEESCNQVALTAQGMTLNREIVRFSHQVTDFCQSFLYKGAGSNFDALQTQYSNHLLQCWKRIVEQIETKEPILQ